MSNTPKGTIIWNLYRARLEFFSQQLFRIPRNKKQIFLWEYSINGKSPLNSYSSITEIKDWMEIKGLFRLYDISAWDNDGNWKAWVLLELPDCQCHTLSS